MNSVLQGVLRYLIGPVTVGGVAILGWTSEFMSRAGQTDLAQLAPTIVVVDALRPDPAADGKLIFLSGTLSASSLKDPDTGLETRGLCLRRQVAVLQWIESRREITRTHRLTGKSRHDHYEYSYQLAWKDYPVDSSKFHDPTKVNPSAAWPPASNFTPQEASVGVYKLSSELLDELGLIAAWHPPKDKPSLAGRWDAARGEFFPGLGPQGEVPAGTRRYTYSVTDLPAEASALGQLSQGALGSFTAPSGLHKPEVRAGKISLEDFVRNDIQIAGVTGWFFRLLDALALMFAVLCLGAGRNWSRRQGLAIAVGLWLLCHALPSLIAH